MAQGALEFLRDRMGIRRLSIALMQPPGLTFHVLGAAPTASPSLRGTGFPVPQPVLAPVLEAGEPLYQRDIAGPPPWPGYQAFLDAGTSSAYLLPLLSSGACFGSLNLGSDRADGFSDEQRRTLALLARRLGPALCNARLFEDLRQKEETYRSIFQAVPVPILEQDCSGIRRATDELVARGVDDVESYLERHPDFLLEAARSIRLLSANDAALALFGAASPGELSEKFEEFLLAAESRSSFAGAVLAIAEGKRQFECEVVNWSLRGERLDLLVRGRLLRRSEGVFQVIVSLLDLTGRKTVERALERRIEFDDLVTVLSTNFINLPSGAIDAGISAALEAIGRSVGVDRSYIVLFAEAGTRIERVLSWCAEGVEDDLSRWIGASEEVLPWCGDAVTHRESTTISSASALPAEAVRERRFLLHRGIKSLVACPLLYRGQSIGLIALDTVGREKRWPADVLSLLKIVGQMFVNALERKWAEEALGLAHKELERRVRDRTADLERAKEALEKDIAARKRAEAEKAELEKQLRHSRVLEAVGLLAGGVAHDFNNILGSVIGCLYVAKVQCPEDSAVREELERAQALCKRGGELTRQLLTVARRRTGRIERVDLPSVLDDVEVLLGRTLPKNIRFSFERAQSLPQVRGDRSMLTSALLNLGVNARDAMPHGGDLKISARIKSRRAKRSFVVIDVSDSGTGIPQSFQDRIFDPFFTTKPAGEGTGLGLSMVYATVAECGGRVSVRSESGVGSTFTVELPAVGPPMPAPGKARAEQSARHPITTAKLLVVEDEENVARLVLQILSASGYAALWVKTGIAALETLRDRRDEIGLVVLDLVLPELGGEEVYRLLKDLTPELPVLLITGREDLARHLAPGGPLLPKPFTAHEFLDSVAKALAAKLR